jgi:chromosome segregation ATPase
MLLRICLVLAILAGLGVIGLSQFVLRPQIQQIVDTRDENDRKFKEADKNFKKTKKDLGDTQARLKTTESNLEETKTQLTASNVKADSEQKRANGLQTDLTKTRSDLKSASDELFRWKSVASGPEQVQELVDSLKSLRTTNDVIQEEKKMLVKKNGDLLRRIDSLTAATGPEDPPVPREVKGKVLVVDPKWDFVILDVGAKNNVPQSGILLVSRNGTLVAKLRVATVEENRSIANVLPGWKLGDILEGDVVVPY